MAKTKVEKTFEKIVTDVPEGYQTLPNYIIEHEGKKYQVHYNSQIKDSSQAYVWTAVS
jgi:hypothetical protein